MSSVLKLMESVLVKVSSRLSPFDEQHLVSTESSFRFILVVNPDLFFLETVQSNTRNTKLG